MKSLLLLVGASLLAVAWASDSEEYPSFRKFMKYHNKHYSSAVEKNFREEVYHHNVRYIKYHNAQYEKGEFSFKLKINHLSDMLRLEYSELLLGFNKSLLAHNKVMESTKFVRTQAALPKELDWRKKRAVTYVKNQSMCGSCWAFSATGALEAHNFISNGKLVPLSEQNLMDCSVSYGNNGCHGGLMDSAFQYVIDNHGIDTEESYSYRAQMGECKFKRENVGAVATGFVKIQEGDEQALMEAVATKGPVSIGIDASGKRFQSYSWGVYDDPDCSSDNLNHGVLLVGYGVEYGRKYWLVKNSWGILWGDNGYIKMARDKNNHCGIASAASFPIVPSNNNSYYLS